MPAAEESAHLLEDSSVLEQVHWPPSVQASGKRPNDEERRTNRREQTEKELEEFEQIEKSVESVAGSSLFDLNSGKKV